VAQSAPSGKGLDQLGPFLFEQLGVVQVYTKLPGRPADQSRPFTLRRGQTVHDVAVLIHKELPGRLTFARLWRHEIEGPSGRPRPPLEDRHVIKLIVPTRERQRCAAESAERALLLAGDRGHAVRDQPSQRVEFVAVNLCQTVATFAGPSGSATPHAVYPIRSRS
jgi:hypothetical protein